MSGPPVTVEGRLARLEDDVQELLDQADHDQKDRDAWRKLRPRVEALLNGGGPAEAGARPVDGSAGVRAEVAAVTGALAGRVDAVEKAQGALRLELERLARAVDSLRGSAGKALGNHEQHLQALSARVDAIQKDIDEFAEKLVGDA